MSDAPVRFVDLKDGRAGSPSRVLSEDLAAAREHGAVDYDVEQGLERFRGLVAGLENGGGEGGREGGADGGGAGPLADGTATTTAATTTGTWSLGVKATIFTTLAIGAVGVGVIAADLGAPDGSIGAPTAPAPTAEHRVELAPTADVEVQPTAAAASDEGAREALDAQDTMGPSTSAAPSSHDSAPTKAPASGAPSGDADGAIGAEMAHLSELRAVASAAPARAVVLADEGHQRFPGGTFGQEREAIAISALARLGRTGEARARAEALLAKHPESPFAESIRAAVGLTTPP